MFLVQFKISYRPFAVQLQSFLKSIGYDAKRDGNEVSVSFENEDPDDILNEGNAFLINKEAEFTSSKIDADDYDDEIINPYEEYGVNELNFY